MRNRWIANHLNTCGNLADNAGRKSHARRCYSWAALADETWSTPHFNLGLLAKYQGEWLESYRFNQRVMELDDAHEGGRWNLGIAATALGDLQAAWRAWERLGIAMPEDGEWAGVMACVRLKPGEQGEVVWGDRLDPARIRVLSVPLPESGRRFKDVILNDGAANGHRSFKGEEVPVFDELGVWRASSYSTYEVTLTLRDGESEQQLVEICGERGLGIEDWSTIRWICAQCSLGNPGPHDCAARRDGDSQRRYAIAAESEEDARAALDEWIAQTKSSWTDLEAL